MSDSSLLFHRIALRIAKRMGPAKRGRALLITSARPGEGKSYIAEALASTFSEQGVGRVALVECTRSIISTGSLHSDGVTFSELIELGASEEQISKFSTAGPLSRIAFGNGETTALYNVRGMFRALEILRVHFAFVILDGPTLQDCVGLNDSADASVLVINADRTRREIVIGALTSSSIGTANVLGAILNERPQHVPRWLYRRAV
jgi:succinoglycan biosynthesis transport protein ExoP